MFSDMYSVSLQRCVLHMSVLDIACLNGSFAHAQPVSVALSVLLSPLAQLPRLRRPYYRTHCGRRCRSCEWTVRIGSVGLEGSVCV